MDEPEPAVEWQRKTGKRIFDYASVSSLYEWENRSAIGGWNQYRFVQWASDPNLISTSQQDAIDHPEKYPYNSFSGGGQKLGTAVFKDLNGDRIIDSRDMEPFGYTIIPELTPRSHCRLSMPDLTSASSVQPTSTVQCSCHPL